MFKNLLLDNLTIGILVLNQEFEVKYLNKYMKEILKQYFKNIDMKYFKISDTLKNKLGKLHLEVKECEIEIDKEKYIQIEFHDVSRLKNLEKDLEEKSKNKNKLVAMLDTVQEFIFYLDSEGRLEYYNKAYAEYLNMPYEDLCGRKESEFFSEEMTRKCLENNRIAFEEGNFYEEEYLDGRWYQTFKSRVDLDNNEYGILAMIKEVTEYKRKSLDLREKVYKDLLTGIYNRNFYEEKIREIFKENTEKIFSMMLIDIDKFKEINDSRGHDIGDLVLKKLADILKSSIRKNSDYIIRMGGDEFCLVIEADLEDLKRIYCRVEKEIEKQNSIREFCFGISTGLVQRKSGEKLDNFYKRADIELYKKKKNKFN